VADQEEKLNTVIEELDPELMSRVIDYMTSLISNYDEQIESGEAENLEQMKATQQKVKLVFNAVLRKSMEMKMMGD